VRFFAAQRLQLRNRGRLANVFSKDGDVDVFGEARNQSVSLGERGSAFEQQPGAAGCSR
jgi:hypothetical protein